MAIGTATAILGSAVLGAAASRSASKTQSSAAAQAADVQKSIADQQVELQREQYRQLREDQTPYRQAGYNALAEMQRTAGNVPGAFKFGAGDYQADPGYAFRLSEGQKALDRQAAARGGLISGNALRAAVGFGQEMGSQEYTNAFNRYQQERAAKLQPLQSLAGVGQTTAANLGAAGAANAGAMGNYLTGGAAAGAAGQVGAANAYGNAVGTYINYNQGTNLVNALTRNRPASSPTSFNYYGNSGGYENLDY
jgi:hypothetical protein